jgi:hypothetical protein
MSFTWHNMSEKKIKQKNLTGKFNYLVVDRVSNTWTAKSDFKELIVKAIVPLTTLIIKFLQYH